MNHVDDSNNRSAKKKLAVRKGRSGRS